MQNTNDLFTESIADIFKQPKNLFIRNGEVWNPIYLNNQYMYFLTIYKEILECYSTARLFIKKLKLNTYSGWIDLNDDLATQKQNKYLIKSELFEAALKNYNNVVDLSWMWVYATALIFDNEGKITYDFVSPKTISNNEAFNYLQSIKMHSKNPYINRNELKTLKCVRPAFAKPFNTISRFWEKFYDNELRDHYNFIKSHGKPLYNESLDLCGVFSFENSVGSALPFSTNDIRFKISLNELIDQTIIFDNEELFPYILKLYKQLEFALPNKGEFEFNKLFQ